MCLKEKVLAAALVAAALSAIVFVAIELVARDSSDDASAPATTSVEPASHPSAIEPQRSSPSSASHREPAARRAARGSVRGRLVDARDGTPVSGVTVRLGESATSSTTSQGEFHFDDATSGTHDLSIEDDFLRPSSPRRRATVPDGGVCDLGDVPVSRGAKLVGRVVGEDGRPVARASVRAIAADDFGARLVENGDSIAASDEDGRFVLRAVAAGRPLDVVATHADLAPGRVERIVAAAGSEARVPDVRLVSGSTITGVVTDSLGGPIAGASVRVRDDDVPASTQPIFERAVETAADGSYRAAHLLAGRYAIVASTPGFASASRSDVIVSRSDGETVSGADLKLPSGWSISGRVVDSKSKPIAGARVIADAQEGIDAAGAPGESPSAASGPDGSFTISGLPSTTYRLSAIARGYVQMRFDVVEAGRTDARIVLCEGASIAGVAKRADADAPVAGAHVVARSTSGDTIPYEAVADANGEFAIVGLPAGPYVVTAVAEDFAPASSDTVFVRDGTRATGIVLRLPAGSRISGVVLDAADRSPIAGALVRLESDADGAGVEDEDDGAALGALEARSGADGAFTIKGPPAGKLVVRASHRDFVSARTRELDLEAGASLDGAEILLPRGGAVRGVVHGDDGQPEAGDRVSVLAADGAIKSRRTDGDGRYEIRGIAPGPCSVLRRRASLAGGQEESHTADVRDGDVVDVDFGRREAGCIVRGTVRLGADAIAFATVNFTSESEEAAESRSAVSDSEGAWAVPGLAPGAYRVSLGGRSGGVPLDCWWKVDVPDAPQWRLDLAVPCGRVAGRVTDSGSGAPVAGALLAASRGTDDDGPPARTTSGSDGTYEFVGLQSGEYTVSATPPFGSLARGEASAVRVTDGAKTTLDLALAAAGMLEGKVVDRSGEPIAGPISGRLLDEHAAEVPSSRFAESAAPAFRLVGLPAGTYTLEVSAAGFATARRSGVKIEAGGTRREEITLHTGGSVRVVVSDADGNEIEGGTIRVVDADEASPAIGGESRGTPDTPAGRTFGRLAPGRYAVLVRLDDERHGAAQVDVEDDRESVARVTVR
jgi:large repetitive protein